MSNSFIHDLRHPDAVALGKLLQEAARCEGHSKSAWEVYTDFLEIANATWRGDDDAYLYAIKRYRPETLEVFVRMFGTLHDALAYSDEFPDLLGEIFQVLYLTNERAGQFFTPRAVCDILSDISMPDADDGGTTIITVNDPACGSGNLLLSAMRKALSIGYPHFWRCRFTGQDIDRRCWNMASLQVGIGVFWHSYIGLTLRQMCADGEIDGRTLMMLSAIFRGAVAPSLQVPPQAIELYEFIKTIVRFEAAVRGVDWKASQPTIMAIDESTEKKRAELRPTVTFNEIGQGELFHKAEGTT